MKPLRILLVDDYVLMRQCLRLLLEGHCGWKVVAEASAKQEAVEAAEQARPDLILLDLQLKDGSGLDIVPHLLALEPAAHVLVLTASACVSDYQKALAAGARGVVLKQDTAETLLKAMERVCEGEVWITPYIVGDLFGCPLPPSSTSCASTALASPASDHLSVGQRSTKINSRAQSLTAREQEVVVLACRGLKNQEIAARLFITERTVRFHLNTVFGKLGVKGRVALVAYVYGCGLVQFET